MHLKFQTDHKFKAELEKLENKATEYVKEEIAKLSGSDEILGEYDIKAVLKFDVEMQKILTCECGEPAQDKYQGYCSDACGYKYCK